MSTINHNQLRLLAIFAWVVECGSFAEAARKLSSSRSRISEQVAQLEAALGVRLLQRTTRQLTVTSEGQKVYQQAIKLDDILKGVEAVTIPSRPSGRVVMTMNHDIAHKYVLPVLADFQNRSPDIALDFILDDARVDLIKEQIDLAIRIGIPKDESLIARVMHEERFGLFASPQFLQRYGVPKSINKVEQLPWVIMTQTSVQYLRYKSKTIEIKPTQSFRCNSPLMVQQMVLNGLGIGIMLPTTVRQEINQGKLVRVMPALDSEKILFSLVYPSRRQLPLRTRTVVDFLLEAKIFD
ncbi:LysR family transcriptional regulator [uncultured Shewanella sp.]|uniref:LysR family transcriptional regulator n=1 Tax=uncultured Shewanella sp. TaxID=173975 RepID=UPI00262AD8A4|nr:LysR family transcriptional regulator [uncultured Shewanella sp.]